VVDFGREGEQNPLGRGGERKKVWLRLWPVVEIDYFIGQAGCRYVVR
jgi:hypothetical protein